MIESNKTKLGRKSDYSDEVLNQTQHYLDNFESLGDLLPSVSGLAFHLKKSRSTIYLWSQDNDKEEFGHLVEMILTQQERSLLNGGLSGDFNCSITKLMLSKHGYSDKVANTVDFNEVITPWSEVKADIDKMTGKDFNEIYSMLEDSC